MRRRDFIKAIVGSVAGWPLVALAQKPAKAPLIGVLWPNPPSQFEPIRQGLKDLGYVEGKNIRFEFDGRKARSTSYRKWHSISLAFRLISL